MQIIWLITTALTLVFSTEATKENIYASLYHTLSLRVHVYRKCILIN